MTTIAEALRANDLRCGPSRSAHQMAWTADGETLGTIRDHWIDIERNRYRLEATKTSTMLVDEATNSRVIAFTSLSHGPATIRAAGGRYRLVREHLVPVLFHVTEDLRGSSVLRIAKLGQRLRYRTTDDSAQVSDHDLTLLAVVSTLHLLKVKVPAPA